MERIAEAADDGQRLDNLLLAWTNWNSRHLIHKLIRKGAIRINHKRVKANTRVHCNDLLRYPDLSVASTEAPSRKAQSLTVPLSYQSKLEEQIIFEDEWFIAVNKPPGWSVHSGTHHRFGIVDLLRARKQKGCAYINLAHRLDQPTSGVLLLAKSAKALQSVHEQFRDHSVRKVYRALVHGDFSPEKGEKEIENYLTPLSNHDDAKMKLSRTTFKSLKSYKNYSLIEAIPDTGRRHQIRIHASQMGHPILMDRRYIRGTQLLEKDRIMNVDAPKGSIYLHAYQLTFFNPFTGKAQNLKAKLPEHWETKLKG